MLVRLPYIDDLNVLSAGKSIAYLEQYGVISIRLGISDVFKSDIVYFHSGKIIFDVPENAILTGEYIQFHENWTQQNLIRVLLSAEVSSFEKLYKYDRFPALDL